MVNYTSKPYILYERMQNVCSVMHSIFVLGQLLFPSWACLLHTAGEVQYSSFTVLSSPELNTSTLMANHPIISARHPCTVSKG